MAGALNIVILTGAGVSADSGISTFRDPEGVWAKIDYRRVATPEGFAADPTLVHKFYNERRAGLRHAQPNDAHTAIACLQQELSSRGGSLTLITQNVDDLHERAGTHSIMHLHGELVSARCCVLGPHSVGCGEIHHWERDLSLATQCPACGSSGAMRPDIVWFGEMPRLLDAAEAALLTATLFVSIGTSGSVYPAAGLVHLARLNGARCMELNLEPSENAGAFDDARYGSAVEIVPAWVDEFLSRMT